MKIKNLIAMGAVVVLVAGSALNVSAAEKLSGDELKALKESGNLSLIIDVDAYKAAYSDLEKAFGDDVDAYINHYLTVGVYEGRTKGVLFDPLAYAQAYGDIKEAFGNNISAIVNHYVAFGVKENRTVGTANGYADIATAEKNGAAIPRASMAGSYVSNVAAGGYAGNAYVGNAIDGSYSGIAADGSVIGNAVDSIYNGSIAGSNSAAGSYVNNAAASNNAAGSNSAAASYDNSTAASNSAAGSYDNSAAASNNAAGDSSAEVNQSYHHTTSIYDDETKNLLRVEYYDENNKLSQYSDVEYTDSSTNSYKENVYHWDEEKGEEVLDRTDTYVNGTLASSENHG